jgi:dCMP deaminase
MPTQNKYDNLFMEVAEKFAELSNCVSFQVGCVIVRDQRIISVGYNGTLSGVKNCYDKFPAYSPVNGDREIHYQWSSANEIHAEMNAILYAVKVGIAIENSTLYSTIKPCQHCMKNILQAGIKRIVYKYPYDKDVEGETVNDFIRKNNIIVEKL